MSDIATTIDNYLLSRFGISLEDALISASEHSGATNIHSAVEIATRRVGPRIYDGDHDGLPERFESAILLEGIVYRCCYSLITDGYGKRQIETIERFDPIGWHAQVLFPL